MFLFFTSMCTLVILVSECGISPFIADVLKLAMLPKLLQCIITTCTTVLQTGLIQIDCD